MTRMRVWACVASVVLVVAAIGGAAVAKDAAPGAKKIRALVLTGGHGFDQKAFPEFFAGHDDIEVTFVALKKGGEAFEDTSKWDYDTIVMYNMSRQITPKQQANFLALLDKGVGLVVMHHAFANYNGWPKFRQIAGVCFILKQLTIDGKVYKRCGYKHGCDMKIHVVDTHHPVTAGTKDFVIHDETYNHQWWATDSHVLLTTDHPLSDKNIAVARMYGKARICSIQLGHDKLSWQNENYRRLMARAIRWTARAIGEDLKPAKAKSAKGASAPKGAAGKTAPPADCGPTVPSALRTRGPFGIADCGFPASTPHHLAAELARRVEAGDPSSPAFHHQSKTPPPGSAQGASAPKGAKGKTAPAPDPAKIVAAVATYKFGQSRKPLLAAEKVILGTIGQPAQRQAIRQALAALLTGQATPDAKGWACQQLRDVGQAEQVPALAALLKDKALAHMARTALEGIPGDEASAALRAALGQTKGLVLVGVINSVGRRKDQAAVGALGKLATSKDLPVACAALHALGQIGGKQAHQAVEAAAAGAPKELAQALVDAKLRVAESLLAGGDKTAAAGIYRGLMRKGAPRHIIAAALAGLLAAEPAKAAHTLLELLTTDDPALAALAAAQARSLDNDEALAVLAAQLPKLPAEGQAALLRSLTSRPDAPKNKAVLAAARTAAAGKAGPVRTAALEALGQIGGANDVPALVAVLAAGGADAVYGQAGLRRLRGDGVDAAIAACLPSAKGALQVELIRLLSARQAKSQAPALLALAGGTDTAVAGEALKALTQLAGDDALGQLIELTVTLKDAGCRARAGKAVEAICRRIDDKDKAAGLLLARWDKASPAVRVTLVGVLGRIGGAKALAAVSKAAKDDHADVQDAGIRALAAWPTPDAMDGLLAIVRSAKSPVHRVLAFRGYVRLIGAAARPAKDVISLYRTALSAAPRPEDKKLVLAALAKRDDPAALDMALTCCEDASLRAEAALAAVKIASACGGSYPKQARAGMEKLISLVDDKAVQARARIVIKETTGEVRVAVNFAGDGKATSPDGWDSDGGSKGDAAAIDGNETTYWDEADGKKLYRLVVTFPQPRGVGGISIVGYQQGSFCPVDFDIVCDGKVVKQVRGAKYSGSFLTVVFDEVSCTSVELKITRYTGNSPAIRELGIYGRKAVATTLAGLKKPVKNRAGKLVTRRKIAQLANGAWICREAAK